MQVNFLMFEDHEMVRRAACECLSNLVTHSKMIEYFRDAEKIRLWIALMRDYEEDFETARAATSGLAMACSDEEVVNNLLSIKGQRGEGEGESVEEGEEELVGVAGVLEILECGNLDLMHRGFHMVKMMLTGDGGSKEGERVDLLAKGINFITQIAGAGEVTGEKLGENETKNKKKLPW